MAVLLSAVKQKRLFGFDSFFSLLSSLHLVVFSYVPFFPLCVVFFYTSFSWASILEQIYVNLLGRAADIEHICLPRYSILTLFIQSPGEALLYSSLAALGSLSALLVPRGCMTATSASPAKADRHG